MAPDETGARYDRLVVLARDTSSPRRAMWHCVCDCGKRLSVLAHSLRSGNTRSCGCTRVQKAREKWTKPPGHAAFQKAVGVMQRNAANRGLEWTLTNDQVREICAQSCHYCGAPPSNVSKATFDSFVYSGIDRVDNGLGYVPGNVVPCCKACNTAKSDMSVKQFRDWVLRVFLKFEGENHARAILG